MTVVNLALIKSHVEITREADDSRIQLVLDAALEMVTDIIGPLSGAASGRVISDGVALVIPSIPVLSVTQVVNVDDDPDTVVDLSGYTVDLTTGIIYGLPAGTYTVTYQAGWTTVNGAPDVPADMAIGIIDLFRRLWSSYRGPVSRSNQPAESPQGASYSWALDRFSRYRAIKVA